MTLRAARFVVAALLLCACGRSPEEDLLTPTQSLSTTPTPGPTPAPTASATPSETEPGTGTPTATAQATPSPTDPPATGTPTPEPPTPTATRPPTPTASPDGDGDGSPDGADCAPEDPAIHPGATEVCSEGTPADEDCDASVDEGLDADGDGVVNCLDPEGCDGGDDDGDGAVDEGVLDSDGDGICDEIDADRDGDRVDDDADPAPDDPAVNVSPTGLYVQPGPGVLQLLAPTGATVSVWVDAGDGPLLVDGAPLVLGVDGTAALSVPAGAVQMEASAPVVAFFLDAEGAGDRVFPAVGADGASVSRTLYVSAESAVTVVASDVAPGTARVDRATGAGWTLVSSVSLAEGRGHTFTITQAGLYRVRSSGGPVSAYGWRLDGTFSGYVRVTGSTGYAGTSVRFQRPASAPTVRLGFSAVDGPVSGSIRRQDVPVASLSLAAAGDLAFTTVTDDATWHLSADAPVMAWMEPAPGLPQTDSVVRDAALVPATDGAIAGTSFLFRATSGGDEALPTALGDVWVQAFDDDTEVLAWIGDAGDEAPVQSVRLSRGGAALLYADVEPGDLVRIDATQPVAVTHAHDAAQFGGTVWVGRAFTSVARGAGESCDPEGALDHCAVGLSCVEGACIAQE